MWVRKTYTGTFKLPNGFLAELSLTHRLRKEKKGNKEKRKKERRGNKRKRREKNTFRKETNSGKKKIFFKTQ